MPMFGFKRSKDPRLESLRKENELLHSQIRQLRDENNKLNKALGVLREELKRLEFIIQDYRQSLFKKKGLFRKKDDDDDYTPKKKGAPLGHKGTTREVPKRVDEHKDILLIQCPECSSKNLTPCDKYYDHYQEDIVIPQTKVTRYRHHYYYCHNCKQTVHGEGCGELPGSYIGPKAKSLAGFLHYQLAVPYRKIKALFKEFFSMDFDPTSCVGFDKKIRIYGQPLYETLHANLKNRPYLHVDETGWKNDWLWCYAGENSAFYKIEPGRGQKELRGVLGESYDGVLVSDMLSAYNRIVSKKQRCLAHILRLIEKWQVYYDSDTKLYIYFERLKNVVKRIILLNKQLNTKKPKDFTVKRADVVGQLRRLLNKALKPVKADKFRRKLLDRFDELVTCLHHKGISSHNNLVERLLRSSVIMRKITFGNCSEKGKRNHEVIMTLTQTARLQNVNPALFLHTLLTNREQAEEMISLM